MSDPDLQPQSDQPERLFKPLKPSSIRTESTESVGGTQSEGAVFQPLKAASIHTEMSSPGDATPLVLVDDDEDGLDMGSEDLTVPELIGEVRGLKSRNQILRTERTSIAGRKYALEQVVESLREKIEMIAERCAALDATGELGDAMKEIMELLGDARRVATDQSVLEEDLEAERAKHLEVRQAFEQKISNQKEKMAGLRSERDSLRAQVGRLERERIGHLESLAEAKDQASDSAAAEEQLEAELERIGDLEQQVQDGEAARLQIEQALEEAVGTAEELTGRVQELESNLSEAESRAREAEQTLENSQAEVEAANTRVAASTARMQAFEDRAVGEQEQLAGLQARIKELEKEVGGHKVTLDEQRKALIEVKPIVEDWGRLDKENQRLGRLVGEARERGRVNIQEIMARAALLKRLEKLTAE